MAPAMKSAWVEWMTTVMGGGSRRNYAATLPPDRFYCLLDELPLHLIPMRTRRWLRPESEQTLHLNPDCILCSNSDLPEKIVAEREIRSAFALQGTVAWVRDGITGNLLPFWLAPNLEAAVRDLKSGDVEPQELDNDTQTLLRAAQILRYAKNAETWSLKREQSLAWAANLFRTKGYAPISDLVHPFHIAALRRYYRYLIRIGSIRLGDGQSPLRYVAYNEPVVRFFHQQIAKTLSMVAGEPLQPSYVYLAAYLGGAELKKHTDRPQCEFSVTFCLDFSPEPALETPWPIELETCSGPVKVYQALGDGLAYRGTRLPHYRGVLGSGQTSTSIFFHYVPQDFQGSLN
jgi:hypothetical protein